MSESKSVREILGQLCGYYAYKGNTTEEKVEIINKFCLDLYTLVSKEVPEKKEHLQRHSSLSCDICKYNFLIDDIHKRLRVLFEVDPHTK